MAALRELHAVNSSSELISRLQTLFSAFGGVRGISNLANGGLDQVFLVDFDREVHAMRAANATGFKLFGFTTLIVNLEKVSSAA